MIFILFYRVIELQSKGSLLSVAFPVLNKGYLIFACV